jgi:hypothetical protein
MKQLAIEWLYDQIENKGKCMYEVFDRAKEMEREQIEEAFQMGREVATITEFNETFKSE